MNVIVRGAVYLLNWTREHQSNAQRLAEVVAPPLVKVCSCLLVLVVMVVVDFLFLKDNVHAQCMQCMATITNTDDIIDGIRLGQDALTKATLLQETGMGLQKDIAISCSILTSDTAKSLQLTSNMITILRSVGLTAGSHPLLGLVRLHQSLLLGGLPRDGIVTQDQLDDAVRAVFDSVSGLNEVLAPGHPVRGIALAELGKILAVDEPTPRMGGDATALRSDFPPSGPSRLRLAYDTLLNARQELLIGFGTSNEGGAVGEEIRQMLVKLEKELSIWKVRSNDALKDAQLSRGMR